MTAWAAILLAGGRGARLGGADKPGLVIGGRTLLDRAIAAVDGAAAVVVVGPRRPTAAPVRWTRERVPGSGPVAALAAGLDAVDEVGLPDDAVVVVLAADLPSVSAATVGRLRAAVAKSGAVLIDDDGRDQWLLSAWRRDALRAVLPEHPENAALGQVLCLLGPARVADTDGSSADIDTPADLDAHSSSQGSHRL
ncbi:molybdenum cofactor guanylyltransferase [Actinokineospora iranica]|uniref:Molybdopterin-guanine dinucleotide biosynthesis protein A n=1 Tax=Actinokineospora iranica TaxID=1271860 RepID=A0A1G6JH05_9PSEU|nr:NTP transferase domain-containing protein [Actinokineospora iranica]SDC18092.1 Molybdopterin-guanine dinucleotide biosynthesis protein A [Actinokineospora iranica]